MTELSFIAMTDNGGRRLWSDRRKKAVPISIPDRRSGKERRSGVDRRGFQALEVDRKKERRRKFKPLAADLVRRH
jgi:hypothetical protein